MAQVTRYHAAALALLVLGVALLVFSWGAMIDATHGGLTYTVEPAAEQDVPSYKTVRSLDSFSPPAQRVFERAQEAPEGSITGTREIDDLSYTTDAEQGVYYVRADGVLYRFEAAADGWSTLPLYAALAVGLPLGLLVCTAALVAFRYRRPLYPVPLVVWTVAFVALVLWLGTLGPPLGGATVAAFIVSAGLWTVRDRTATAVDSEESTETRDSDGSTGIRGGGRLRAGRVLSGIAVLVGLVGLAGLGVAATTFTTHPAARHKLLVAGSIVVSAGLLEAEVFRVRRAVTRNTDAGSNGL